MTEETTERLQPPYGFSVHLPQYYRAHFVLMLTASSLLPPTGLTPAPACDPPNLWALPLLQEMLWGCTARREMLWGMCTWAQVVLLGYNS